ncbi:P-II family nitrogen regulator [Lacinutrix sp.]|jgi:nitrogen regulatory protein P-II 1|uniref:P-II family nitrogen regulator n=1 Tax=Lacinutrix sp. TaxID=1937692 RepID=UPI002615A522|nr:P-II family nitrogen regulator [Lacinutrix sp.]MDG1715839.1 P-II family nitrogen regulator [Lacinutrix sp.]
MKKVEAIIRKSKFKDVTKSLQEVGVNFFSYWDVTGLGIDKEDNDVSSMVIKETNNIKRCYLTIIVNDDFEEVTIKAILESATSNAVGDGMLFVSSINQIYSIRTGEKGSNLLR